MVKRRVHKNSGSVPPIIKKVGFDFDWESKRVWALEIRTERVPITELTWTFSIPFWELAKSKPYGLKPIDVIENPKKYAKEYRRILRSDTKYPIDIMWNKKRWLTLDGLHRLAKLYINGETEVCVRKVPRSAIPKIKPKNI